MAKISIIVAVSDNNVIGANNTLLWKQSDDLQRFKALTLNKTIIMGRNTLLSLPKGALKNRNNIVLTDQIEKDCCDGRFNNCALFSNYCELLKTVCKNDEEVFIIGGGMIYKLFLPLAHKLYITEVHCNLEGDTKFPEIEYEKYKIISSQDFCKDNFNEYDYTFKVYEKLN